ncbi:MAG: YadA-like family protein, partial [Firmicutes bacterium]|nr:YadA-like family protein [Bacillota bacterium]
LGDQIEDLGAETAALAGLKPIQYDPLEPTQIMAAVGHYRGSTAFAVGLAHYTRENVMFHLGASFGRSSHRVLANAGVTFRLGDKNRKNAIPERYRSGPISASYVLQDEVSALKVENKKLLENVSDLKSDNDKLRDKVSELQAGYDEVKEQLRQILENQKNADKK